MIHAMLEHKFSQQEIFCLNYAGTRSDTNYLGFAHLSRMLRALG